MGVINKINEAIKNEIMKSGSMGTETVTVSIMLTDAEKEKFLNCKEYDSKNYWWEFEDNKLIISYTEKAGE